MTSSDGALHHIYFFLQKGSQAAEALEAAVGSSDHIDLTAPAVESEHAPVSRGLNNATTFTSEQATIADPADTFVIDRSMDGDSKFTDPVSDSEDGSWQCIDKPLGNDDEMTTEGRLAKAAKFLTTIATYLTSGEQPDGHATARDLAAAIEMGPSTTESATADVSSEHAPESVIKSDQQRSSEIINAHHAPQLAVESLTETQWQSMAANTLLDDCSRDRAAEGVVESEDTPVNTTTLIQNDSGRSFKGPGDWSEPPRVDSVTDDPPTAALATSETQAASQKTSSPATDSLSEPKQPSLPLTTSYDKHAKKHSNTSSPSRTTPLSISALAFVPFGPVRPPALTITAAAADFVPSAHVPVNTPAQYHRESHRRHFPVKHCPATFELRRTADKGFGLYATRRIPVGTRIICEEPLLQIPRNDIALTLAAYHQLPQKKKSIYDNLHAYAPKSFDFEQEVRRKIGKVVEEQVLASHVRILMIFAANDFILADQSALGVFEVTSRINHTCVPNVHFSNNAELNGKETVHAARDIEEGEELTANYIGGKASYQRTEKRQAYLSEFYGFLCKCDACSGAMPESDALRETLEYIVWGLNTYKYQDKLTSAYHGDNAYYPASRLAALKQAEDAFHILLQLGLITTELAKSYRFASDFALGVGQYEKALHYAFCELNVERNIFGKEVGDLKGLGLAAEQWIAAVQDRMDVDKIPIPGSKFWSNWPEKKAMWYELRKDQKKRAEIEKELLAEEERKNRAAEEQERELVALKNMEKRRKRSEAKVARKSRDIETLKAAEDEKTSEEVMVTEKESAETEEEVEVEQL